MRGLRWVGVFGMLLLTGCGNRLASEFVDGCVKGGSTEKMCECTWEGLEEYYGKDRLQGMEDTGVPAEDFLAVVVKSRNACVVSLSNLSTSEVLGIPRASEQVANSQPSEVAEPDPNSPAGIALSAAQDAEAQQAESPKVPEQEMAASSGVQSSTVALSNHNLRIYRQAEDQPFIVSLDGKKLREVEAQGVSVKWMSGGGGATNYALLGVNSGGSACPMTFFIVEVPPEGNTRVSPEFGSCSDLITSANALPGGVSVSMPDFLGPFESPEDRAKAANTTKTYFWQDGVLKET